MDLLGRLRSRMRLAWNPRSDIDWCVPMTEIETDRLDGFGGMSTGCGREEKEDRGGLETKLHLLSVTYPSTVKPSEG